MSKFDANRLFFLFTVIILVLLTGLFGYRLEIGSAGLTFEPRQALPTRDGHQ